jgi:hypothetical protein
MSMKEHQPTWLEVCKQWHGSKTSLCHGLGDHLDYLFAIWDGEGRLALPVKGAVITDHDRWLRVPRLLSELGEADRALAPPDAYIGPKRCPQDAKGVVYPGRKGEGWHISFWQPGMRRTPISNVEDSPRTWDDVLTQWGGRAVTPCQGLNEYLAQALEFWERVNQPVLPMPGGVITDLKSWLAAPRLLSELSQAEDVLSSEGLSEEEEFLWKREAPVGWGVIYPDRKEDRWHVQFTSKRGWD